MVTAASVIALLVVPPILLIRFRKRWVAAFNLAVTNLNHQPIRRPIARLRHFTHVGRKSGSVYRAPVNVFSSVQRLLIALTYSSQSEWVKNVLAAGVCKLKTRGRKYQPSAPNVVRDLSRQRFPIPVRVVLRLVGADEYMELAIG
jgi:deazaflavin-dependent oxidoreductase (nitroreductase family)